MHLLSRPGTTTPRRSCAGSGWPRRCWRARACWPGRCWTRAGDWQPDEAITIVPDELALDSVSEAFQALSTDYRLSLPYIARVVCIEGRREPMAEPVTTVAARTDLLRDVLRRWRHDRLLQTRRAGHRAAPPGPRVECRDALSDRPVQTVRSRSATAGCRRPTKLKPAGCRLSRTRQRPFTLRHRIPDDPSGRCRSCRSWSTTRSRRYVPRRFTVTPWTLRRGAGAGPVRRAVRPAAPALAAARLRVPACRATATVIRGRVAQGTSRPRWARVEGTHPDQRGRLGARRRARRVRAADHRPGLRPGARPPS